MMQKREYDIRFKIILLGDNCVGKSCLLQSYFEEYIDFYDYIDTCGVDAKLKELILFNKSISLRIWDASGTPKFRSLITPYVQDADGALICFDLTNSISFQKVKEFIKYFKTHKKNAPIIILGCKSDLVSQRLVSQGEAKALANELNVDYIEVSARKKMNVKKGFEQITQQLYYNFQINKIRRVLEQILYNYLTVEASNNRSDCFSSPNKEDILKQEYQNNINELFQSKSVSAIREFCVKTLDLIKKVDVLFEKEHPILNIVSSSSLSNALKQSFNYIVHHIPEEIIDFSSLQENIVHKSAL